MSNLPLLLGIPARASEVNSETAFALKLWGVQQPRKIEDLLVENPKAGVCLVDHQQTSQLNPAIKVAFILVPDVNLPTF